MKRKLALILALGLALALLTGCEMFVPDPTERPSNWWESAEPTGSAEPAGSAEPSESQAGWQEGVGPDYDRLFVHDDICSTGDALYFRALAATGANAYRLIYYADKATGICLPLCGKPECTHNNENCNAYAQGGFYSGLTDYNGRLYWIGQAGHWMKGGYHWYVYSMAYDGTDRREVREIPSDWISGRMQTRTVFHRGYVYTCNLGDAVVNGKAKEVVDVEAYPLEGDGDRTVILRAEEVKYNHVTLQAYEEYVYIAFEGEDGVFELHRWDTRAGELETLYRGDAPIYWEEQFWVTEDGVVFGSREYTETDAGQELEYALYRFSFETRQIELLNRLRINEGGGTGIVILDGLVIANWSFDSGAVRILAKDFAGQTVLDATFEGVGLGGCYGMDEDYLYFCNLFQYVSVSRDGNEIRLLFDRWPD